jgi:hypothetical protein
VPALQLLQLVELAPDHVPALQTRQVVIEVAALDDDQVPALQVVHTADDCDDQDPGLQDVHDVAPEAE